MTQTEGTFKGQPKMTLESYLKTGKSIGITRFYVEEIQIEDGETSFYIHPVDDMVRVGGEPMHYVVTGDLLERVERDTIIQGQEQIDSLRSELSGYSSSLGLDFNSAIDDIPTLILETRKVLAALNSSAAAHRSIQKLKTELLRHEAIIGIQREDDGDFNAFANRIEYVFSTYRKDIRSLEKVMNDTIEDLALIAQCKETLTRNNWSSSVYGCIQIIILKICGLAAERLQRSLKDPIPESYDRSDF
ncbi:hypothetical protein [Argonema galeatum]|uniref:hypothetical protein n=1 Tax=Argonema galeatum TaxID=2942762 RepID=UPI0020115801|nr:hypothetical protein [Argonema galeatum]MCL1469024.1 hypothetical protein [Argonema galeatum A003/A1]